MKVHLAAQLGSLRCSIPPLKITKKPLRGYKGPMIDMRLK